MAAATVTGRFRNEVFSTQRFFGAASIAFAANGDTLTVPGMKTIKEISLTPTTNSSYGFTVAGNVITLVSGGAVTFRGGVVGL